LRSISACVVSAWYCRLPPDIFVGVVDVWNDTLLLHIAKSGWLVETEVIVLAWRGQLLFGFAQRSCILGIFLAGNVALIRGINI